MVPCNHNLFINSEQYKWSLAIIISSLILNNINGPSAYQSCQIVKWEDSSLGSDYWRTQQLSVQSLCFGGEYPSIAC